MHVLADPRQWDSAAPLTIVFPSIFGLVTSCLPKDITGHILVSAVAIRSIGC